MKPCWTVDDLCVFGRFLCRFLLLAWRPDSPLEGWKRKKNEPTDSEGRPRIACVFSLVFEFFGILVDRSIFGRILRR